MSIAAEDFVPFDYIGEDFTLSINGDVSFGIELRMKEVFSMADIGNNVNSFLDESAPSTETNLFYHAYKHALSMLGEDVTIQKYNFFYALEHQRMDTKSSLTATWNQDKFAQRDVMFDKVYLIISFHGHTTKSNSQKIPLIKRLKQNKDLDVLKIEEYRQIFQSFFNSMSADMDTVIPLSGDDILSVMYDVWNNKVDSGELLQDIKVESNGLVVGSDYVGVLSSRKLARNIEAFSSKNTVVTESRAVGSKTEMVNEIRLPTSYLFCIGMGIPIDHIIIETLEIPDKDVVETKLTKEWSNLNFFVGIGNRSAKLKRQVIDNIKDVRAEYGHKYAYWSCVVLVKGRTPEERKTYTDLVGTIAAKNIGMTFVVDNHSAWQQFYYSLPGMGRKLKNLRLGYLETFSYLTHVESFKTGNKNGIVLVDAFGRPFLQEFWYNKYLEAVNGLVFGPTGQGKSVTVNNFLDQCFHNGDIIFIIDVGGSYRRITQVNKGVYIDSTNLKNLSFNPFLDCYQRDGIYYPELNYKGETDVLYVDYVVGIILSCWYENDIPDRIVDLKSILGKMVKGYFRKYNEKEISRLGMNSFYDFALTYFVDDSEFKMFFDTISFKLRMELFVNDGELAFMLNNEKPFEVNNRWTVFDLGGILKNDQISGPVLVIILQLFKRKLAENFGSIVRFWIDEAMDFLKVKSTAAYFAEAYRKIRKEGAQIVLITQSIDYLNHLDGDVRSSILSNTDIKILMNHSGKEMLFDTMQKDLGLSASDMELLRNQTPIDGTKYRIAFMKYGKLPGFLFRVEISEKTYSLYQTNAKEIKMIDELLKTYDGNVEVAVDEFIDKKKQGLLN